MFVGASKHLLTNVIFLGVENFLQTLCVGAAELLHLACSAQTLWHSARMLHPDWGLNLPAHRVSRVGQAFKSQKNTFKCVKLTFFVVQTRN